MLKKKPKPPKEKVEFELTSLDKTHPAEFVLTNAELLTHILSCISTPEELTKLRQVSKFWQNVSDTHPNWRTILQEELSKKVEEIPSEQARKQYVNTRKYILNKKSGRFFGMSIPVISEKFQKNDEEVFMAALADGNFDAIKHFLQDKSAVNKTFTSNYFIMLGGIWYTESRPIHIAIINDNPQLVEFLLREGADVNCELTRTISSSPMNIQSMTTGKLAQYKASHKVTSLIMLAYTEVVLNNQDSISEQHIALAKKFFKKSYELDPKTTHEYITNVLETKKGFQITYYDETIKRLNDFFQTFLQQQNDQSSCTLS